MKLRSTRKALDNLDEIAAYLNARNPVAAIRVRETIEATLVRLLMFPYAGRRQTTEGVRKAVSPGYFYIVYYTVSESTDELIVLSIKHPAREREHDDV
jgi:toxin ParE1/3/4